ncbi:MAG: hypothetical protein LBU94_04195 [Clostridiales bacterium]|jgi:hypothetical protein|nr:hypothetical protein [Clostridiales bacterium]
MIEFEQFALMLDEIAESFPPEIYVRLNGGINLIPGYKIHPESDKNDLSILGEYCWDNRLGRFIRIYYDSFSLVYGHLSDEKIRKKAESVLKHEFLHHLESMAGEKDLEIKDAMFIAKYKQVIKDDEISEKDRQE